MIRSITGSLLAALLLAGCEDDPPLERELEQPPTLDGTVLEAQGEALERARAVEQQVEASTRRRMEAVDGNVTAERDDEEG